MWGVFFEDINGGADGGLYAELVRNRSFEFTEPTMGWGFEGLRGGLRSERPIHPDNPHYLHLELGGIGPAPVLTNDGFAGMGVKQGESYRFSAFGRGTGAARNMLRVDLMGAEGRRLGGARLGGFSGSWSRQEVTFRCSATEARARLVVTVEGGGTLDLDMISLFPVNTWKQRKDGLRADLVQMLADLRPGFVRFPGGCIVEGRTLENRYPWKNTIGAPEQRKLLVNRWSSEFKHRPAPDYHQTFGLGFFEYFQMCEDIGAEPLPILNCGMACQFNTAEVVPLDRLDPYVQDALDLVEFANGPVTTPWGSQRAALGHPEPFGMKFLGIGNEQWGPQYVERYAVFAREIHARFPEIRLIASAGPSPEDERFHFLWPKLRELNADIVDEHCYDGPAWFLDNAGRYDRRARSGPKVFMGEYAAQSVKTGSPDNRNTWETALAEAAYLTGLERNADLVVMASYAPLFGHEERWQWRPNLIWMDNLRAYGTPNYYVQQLFSRNRGDRVVEVEVGSVSVSGRGAPRFFASAVREENPERSAGTLVLKLVNATAGPVDAVLDLAEAGRVSRRGQAITLANEDPAAENSLEQPLRVAPVTRSLSARPKFTHPCPPYSVTVLRLPLEP